MWGATRLRIADQLIGDSRLTIGDWGAVWLLDPSIPSPRGRSPFHPLHGVHPRRCLYGWTFGPWWRWCAPAIMNPTMIRAFSDSAEQL